MARRRSTNDLFELFPDLPGMPYRDPQDRLARLRLQVEETRRRAGDNILRQRAASERVRAAITPWRRKR